MGQSSPYRRIDAGGKALSLIGDTGGRGFIELQNACFQGSNGVERYGAGSHRQHGCPDPFRFDLGEAGRGSVCRQILTRESPGFTWLMVRFMIVMVCIVFLIQGLTKEEDWTPGDFYSPCRWRWG